MRAVMVGMRGQYGLYKRRVCKQCLSGADLRDNVLNGDETDIDCGGAICNACDEGQACAANNDCASDVCADNVCAPCRIFVGWGDNNGDVTHGSIWSYQGNQGVAAANAMCAQVAADARACTYAELVTANQQGDFNQEFVNSQGETGWVHRVATTVTVNGRDIAPGAGARCVDWTYGSNHLADGEYFTINADGLTFTFDPDPTVRGATDCGGVQSNCLLPSSEQLSVI